MPDGLVLNPDTGMLVGIPAVPGTVPTITVTATWFDPGTAAVIGAATQSFLLTIDAPPSLCSTTPGPGPFTDVGATHQFCGDIEWTAASGITSGYEGGDFRPSTPVSRKAMAAFLYRFAYSPHGLNPTCSAAPFTDVAAEDPFCGYIDWLVDEGITAGVGDGSFGATNPVTRGAMAAFLYRFAGSPNGPNPTCTVAPFEDVPTTNPFCGYIAWLVTTGVTSGATATTYLPGSVVSRGSMAAFLRRLDHHLTAP